MNSKKCDRCGRFYQPQQEGKINIAEYPNMRMSYTDNYFPSDINLCNKCARSFEEWWKNNDKKMPGLFKT